MIRRAGERLTVLLNLIVEAKDLYRLGEGLSEDMTRRLPEVIEATKGVLNAFGTPWD